MTRKSLDKTPCVMLIIYRFFLIFLLIFFDFSENVNVVFSSFPSITTSYLLSLTTSSRSPTSPCVEGYNPLLYLKEFDWIDLRNEMSNILQKTQSYLQNVAYAILYFSLFLLSLYLHLDRRHITHGDRLPQRHHQNNRSNRWNHHLERTPVLR